MGYCLYVTQRLGRALYARAPASELLQPSPALELLFSQPFLCLLLLLCLWGVEGRARKNFKDIRVISWVQVTPKMRPRKRYDTSHVGHVLFTMSRVCDSFDFIRGRTFPNVNQPYENQRQGVTLYESNTQTCHGQLTAFLSGQTGPLCQRAFKFIHVHGSSVMIIPTPFDEFTEIRPFKPTVALETTLPALRLSVSRCSRPRLFK